MRLKQLLSAVLAVPLFTALAAGSQLTAVSVQAKGDSTAVTIHANGALTHNEYRPVDTLLLVDFPGATVGKLDSSAHSLNVPGVTSYQVHSYKAANGDDIARVEFTLDPHVSIRFSNEKNALMIAVSAPTGTVSDVTPASRISGPVVPSATPNSKLVAQVTKEPSEPVQVRGISVVRGHEGTNVEIRANGLLSPKILTLKSPDRLVIDLANAIPESSPHEIPVHAADLNAVRMARYQSNPPTTRVVLDLKAPQDFQLASMNDKLIVKLRPLSAAGLSASPAQNPAAVTAKTTAPATIATTLPNASTSGPAAKPVAQDYVMVQPHYSPVTRASQTSSDQPFEGKTPTERAADAARVLGAAAPVEIPLSATPTEAAIKPEVVKAAMMQAAQPATSGNAQAASAAASTSNCNTGRYTGEPISVNLKDVDLKDFFRLIHEISGLNVVLDPGVTGTLTIVLDDVPWDQALAIVLQNNSLQCQLNGNVLRIALPDTLRKEAEGIRATQEAQALAVDRVTVTRYLSYATAKNVVPTLKAFLSKRGDIISDDRTNSIIVQDIPSVIPGIDRLIKELDQKTPQVEIEARVVAATRSFARDLGTQFGFGIGNNATAVGGAAAVGSSPTQVTTGPPTNQPVAKPFIQVGTGQIPLFSNLPAGPGPTSGLTFLNEGRNYRIDAILTAAESRGLLKVLSRPRIVTQNNIQALVRQGVRIPVVTAAQLGGPPTTTYIDAFLRLQVQPQITVEHTIFLNVDVENTTPNFAVNVQGNPELVEQQATTQVLVSDGGTVVIGGVIQTQDTVTLQQVPFLGNVPVFGNLFKRKSVSTSTQELIFFITPRIVQS